MKLDNLISNAPVAVQLRAIEGMQGYEPGQPLMDGDTPVVIFLHYAGYNCNKFQAERLRQQQIEESKQVLNSEARAKNRGKFYASLIVGWQGIDTPYSYDAAVELFALESSAWLIIQINDALDSIAKKFRTS